MEERGVSISELETILDIALETDVVPIISGPPGVGKSSLVRQRAAKMKYKIPENKKISKVSSKLAKVYGQEFSGALIKDVRLGLCGPTEIKGIPVFDVRDGEAIWVNTRLFPVAPDVLASREEKLLDTVQKLKELEKSDGDTTEIYDAKAKINRLERFIEQALHEQFSVLFLDELTQAPVAVQNAAFSLILDRTVGTYSVPDGVTIIAAGNRKEDLAGANRLNSALTSRFLHITVANPTYDDFEKYAQRNMLDSEITGFLSFKKDMLFDFNPSKIETTFPCPRTWEFASKQLKAWKKVNGSQDALYHLMGGCVGYAVALMFISWRNLYVKLPPVDDLLKGKITRSDIDFAGVARSSVDDDGDIIASDISLVYAYTMSLIQSVSENRSKGYCENLAKFLLAEDKNRMEWTTVALKNIATRDDGLISEFIDLPEWAELLKEIDLGDIFND